MYWLSRYLDPVTLTYISHSSNFYTFYVEVPLSLGCIIRNVSAEDIAIRGNGTGLECMCLPRNSCMLYHPDLHEWPVLWQLLLFFFFFFFFFFFIAPACSRVRYRRPIFRPSVRPSVCQHLCRRSTFMSKLVFWSTTRLNNHQTLHETSPWPPDFAT